MRSKLLIASLGAAVGLLLATNPVLAQAAGMITSGDIVNNTIKGKDVKDSSLRGKDVRNDSLTGVDIAEGTLSGVNATTLAGKSPGDLGVRTRAYQAAVNLPSTSQFTMNLPTIPAGTYLVSLNAFLYGTSSIYCALTRPAFVGAAVVTNIATGPNNTRPVSGSGVYVHNGSPLEVICSSDAASAWSSYSGAPLQVSLTKIDDATVAAGTASRSTPADRAPRVAR